MKRVAIFVLVAVVLLGLTVWRGQLFTVSRPGDGPRPLAIEPIESREHARVDVVLPAVPAGMKRLRGGDTALLIHYWAPWEQHSRAQATELDSLRRHPDLQRLHVVLVCFDPFPSVARFVARQRLRLNVLLDSDHQLRAALPCPSVPYTYVLDRNGRIAVAQPGEVDWWSPQTIDGLRTVVQEPSDRSLTHPS